MFNRQSVPKLINDYYHDLESNSNHLFKKKKAKQPWLRLLNYSVWICVALIVILIINAWLVLPSVTKLYQSSIQGKANLETSLYLLSDKKFDQAAVSLTQAQSDFQSATTEMHRLQKTPIAWLPFVRFRLAELERLLSTADRLTVTGLALNSSMNNILKIIPDYSLPNYNKLDAQQKQNLWQAVYQTAPQLTRAKDDLTDLAQQLRYLGSLSIVKYYQLDLVTIDTKLQEAIVNLNRSEILARILPQIIGYPDSARYLIVLQNNHELRPTGGFIGTYGIATVKNGQIVNLSTDDVYHLDMPVSDKLKVDPPAPLKKYLKINNWFLRDSNWSPDWPTSAQKIVWFYNEENKLLPKGDRNTKFDFVLAATPDLIINLLDITGPIKVDGQTYHQGNFMELLQETTELNYAKAGLSSWNRKQVVGKLAQLMQLKIISQLDNKRAEIIAIFQKHLNEKNLLVYTQKPELTQYLRNLNWDGQVIASEDDYLMVVDANLAALKTDAVINRNIDYQLEETDKGVIAHLKINYANTGKFSWKTTRYQSFTRIYVPQGSTLIKAAGFFGNPNDIVTGEELGKTYFGAYLEIEPGKIGGLSFDYYLPYNTWQRIRTNNYRLYIQKQPGNNTEDLRVKLSFIKKIKDYEPNSLHATLAGNQISWKDNLSTDKSFSVTLY